MSSLNLKVNQEPQRIYFTAVELSKQLNVKVSAIKHWVNTLQIPFIRHQKGVWAFTVSNSERLRQVAVLRGNGVSLTLIKYCIRKDIQLLNELLSLVNRIGHYQMPEAITSQHSFR